MRDLSSIQALEKLKYHFAVGGDTKNVPEIIAYSAGTSPGHLPFGRQMKTSFRASFLKAGICHSDIE